MAKVVSTIAVEIKLDDRHFNTGMRRAASNMQAFARKGSGAADMTGTFNANSARLFHFSKLFGNSMGLMSLAVHPVTLAMIELGQQAFNIGKSIVTAGVEWESAFASVAKTVHASQAELDILEGQLRRIASWGPDSLAVGLKNAHMEIAKIAEVAGTLGLASDEIDEFSEQISILVQNASDLTSEDAARSVAQFGQITGMDFANTSNFAAAVTELGNSFPTTEGSILEFSKRIAAAGAQADMTKADILGLAAGLSSVGLRPELAGTNFTKFMNKVTKAVADWDLSGEISDEYGRVLAITHMSADEFSRIWSEDATEGILQFAAGMSELTDAEQLQALDEMSLDGQRVQDVLRRMALAQDMFRNAVETSNTAWEENTAHMVEAEARLDTLDAQWNRLHNTLYELKVLGHESFFEGILTDGLNTVNTLADLFHVIVDPSIAIAQEGGGGGDFDMASQIVEELGLGDAMGGMEVETSLTITIPPGGTLWAISQDTGIPIPELMEQFGIEDARETQPGQYEFDVPMGMNVNLDSQFITDIAESDVSGIQNTAQAIWLVGQSTQYANIQAQRAPSSMDVLVETLAAIGVEAGVFDDREAGRDFFSTIADYAGIANKQLAPFRDLLTEIGGFSLDTLFDFDFVAAGGLTAGGPAVLLGDLVGNIIQDPPSIDLPVNFDLPPDPTTEIREEISEQMGDRLGWIDIPASLSMTADMWSSFKEMVIAFEIENPLTAPVGLFTTAEIVQGLIDQLKTLWEEKDVILDVALSLAEGALSGIISDIEGVIPSWLSLDVPDVIPGNATGGPVEQGRPYVVGERGPEMFVPRESGRIVPTVPHMAASAGAPAGGGGITIANLTVNGVQDLRGLVAEIERLQRTRMH